MPYKDLVKRARVGRASKRNTHHGWDWRGLIEYYGRTCANTEVSELNGYCLETESLELHEPFGEMKSRAVQVNTQGMFQMRVLLCRHCHRDDHQRHFSMLRGLDSLYLLDTDAEIMESDVEPWAAKLQVWYDKYRVGESLGMGLVTKGLT